MLRAHDRMELVTCYTRFGIIDMHRNRLIEVGVLECDMCLKVAIKAIVNGLIGAVTGYNKGAERAFEFCEPIVKVIEVNVISGLEVEIKEQMNVFIVFNYLEQWRWEVISVKLVVRDLVVNPLTGHARDVSDLTCHLRCRKKITLTFYKRSRFWVNLNST